MAERDVRQYLKQRIEALGGEVRAVAWLGRRHAPDVLVLLPERTVGGVVSEWRLMPRSEWVECKAPDGRLRPGQQREHERMRAAGCVVHVIWSEAQVDEVYPL